MSSRGRGRGHQPLGPAPSRKGALLASNGLAVVGGALLGGAKLGPTYTLIIIGRFVTGAYAGTAPLKGPRPGRAPPGEGRGSGGGVSRP